MIPARRCRRARSCCLRKCDGTVRHDYAGSMTGSSTPRLTRAQREALVLDTAARLFYARGVHEVGMDELVQATGLGKATVYRLYPGKDDLVAAYLGRLAGTILDAIDAE